MESKLQMLERMLAELKMESAEADTPTEENEPESDEEMVCREKPTSKIIRRKVKSDDEAPGPPSRLPAEPKEGAAPKPHRLERYRTFVRQINTRTFMTKFKGKGKRAAQSLLYEFDNDLDMNDHPAEKFNSIVEELEAEIAATKPKQTLEFIKRFLSRYRKSIVWNNDMYLVARK